KWLIKKASHTKPGSLLKSQIPIKTFGQWNENRPGFIEIDLVDHSGGVARGIYSQTLDATDVFTGWTETICVDNKSQMKVFEGLKKIKERFPFPIIGIDSDNGAEFVNKHLLKYCQENQITFTKSRAYNKNDSCYVEQKNWTIVRKAVGYWRYETEEEINLLNQIYLHLRLYTNFFQPQMKCIMRSRIGSKIIKRYDIAKTPYQRVIECDEIGEKTKKELEEIYKRLNPAQLQRQIIKLQEKLFEIVRRKRIYEKSRFEKEKILV
ncbi:MAG: DDE-type integrase/transposase/recombinase, partial [Candidatus Omnitrophica bacterium]|nr:DDE-type integrase/transposase/recombinase [Candidatus Omnitrophota bacterium]